MFFDRAPKKCSDQSHQMCTFIEYPCCWFCMLQVTIYDPNIERTSHVSSKFHVSVADSGVDAIVDADLVVFAVKPQNIDKVNCRIT